MSFKVKVPTTVIEEITKEEMVKLLKLETPPKFRLYDSVEFTSSWANKESEFDIQGIISGINHVPIAEAWFYRVSFLTGSKHHTAEEDINEKNIRLLEV
jgi:hypothetical protein